MRKRIYADHLPIVENLLLANCRILVPVLALRCWRQLAEEWQEPAVSSDMLTEVTPKDEQ